MTIKDIYKKYYILPNLQEHMMRVCGIAEFIESHWTGEKVDWKSVKTICLLHDIGNIVKFDMDKFPQFLGDEVKQIDYWKEKQTEIREKYGIDDHKATKQILEEIGANQALINTILDKSFGNSIAVAKSDNWLLKILYYCDLRTLPFGIGTLNERIQDARDRMPKYTQREDFDDLVAACMEVGKQVEKNMNVPGNEITNKSAKFSPELLDVEV